jgi:PAS domain S-box-containing protein
MTRKEKLLLTAVAATMITLVLILCFASKIIIQGSYARVEKDLVRQDMGGALDALANEIENLKRTVLDWSEWDDTYAFVEDRNNAYVRKNLPAKTFEDLKLDFMVFIDSRNHIVFGKSYRSGDGSLAPITENFRKQLTPSSPLLKFPGTEKCVTGLMMLPEGPALVSSQAVLTTEGKGPRRGTVIFCRLLDMAETGTLARITHLKLGFLRMDSGYIPAEFKAAWKNHSSPPVITKIKSENVISGYALVKDIYGRPLVVAHADFPRVIYKNGKRTVTYYMGFITGLVFLSALIVLILFNKLALSRKERRESDARYQAVVRQASDVFLLVDLTDKTILEANNSIEDLLGYLPNEVSGLPVYEIIDVDRLPFEEILRQLLDGREKYIIGEIRCRRKTGNLVDVEAGAGLISHEGSTVLCITLRDITVRKRAAERLSRLNDCFLGFGPDPDENVAMLTALCGEMMEAACALFNRLEFGKLCTRAHWNAPPDLDLVDDPQGHLCHDVIRFGSDEVVIVRDLQNSRYAESDPNVRRYALQTYIGAQVKCRGESVGSLCLVYTNDYLPTEYDRKFMGILASAMGVEEERRLAIEALRKSNDELEARVRERTMELSRANEELRIDIMERQKAEEALATSRTLLNNILESIPDLLQIIDKDMRILHSNWHDGYDYVAEDIRDKQPLCYDACYPGQDRPCENCPTQTVFKTGKTAFREKFNPKVGYVEIRAFPIFDESGNVVMVTEHLRNITEQKNMQQEAQKMQKLESLGVLAGGIAHDFNNLLTGILGNISLAKMYLSPANKAFPRLEEAERASERARDLTRQLLTFSKGGAPVRKTAHISQMVRDSASFVLRGSNVRCDFSLPDGLWPVSVDEGQISRVIQNLVINADQAMPAGGIIDVTAENVVLGNDRALPVEEGRYVRITVSDQGVGIPEENLQKVFDPYFTTRKKGSGLGLATVYSIMKNHNGYIHAESKAGKGAVFYVYLPASDYSPEIEEKKESNNLIHLSKGRILVMDDEEIIREIAAEILNHIGYEVSACRDGSEAVTLYQKSAEAKEPFDAVIMDLTVPGGMGGKEAMEKLLKIDPAVKGIVSSGYSSDPVLANYREYGFCGMIAKPYKVEDLQDVLRTL